MMNNSSNLTKFNVAALFVALATTVMNMAIVAKATHAEQAVSERVVWEKVERSGAAEVMAYRAAGRLGLTSYRGSEHGAG